MAATKQQETNLIYDKINFNHFLSLFIYLFIFRRFIPGFGWYLRSAQRKKKKKTLFIQLVPNGPEKWFSIYDDGPCSFSPFDSILASVRLKSILVPPFFPHSNENPYEYSPTIAHQPYTPLNWYYFCSSEDNSQFPDHFVHCLYCFVISNNIQD